MTDAAESAETRSYRGLPGAFRYSFRESDSRVFKLYAVLGGALAVLVSILFALSLIVLIADTVESEGSLSLLRSFFVLVGLLVVLPIVAPVLLVANRHRRGSGTDTRYDRHLGIAGFGFLASLYVGMIPTVPPEHQDVPDGAVTVALEVPAGVPIVGGAFLELPVVPAFVVDWLVAPVVEWLYALPTVAGVALVVLGAASIAVVHRATA